MGIRRNVGLVVAVTWCGVVLCGVVCGAVRCVTARCVVWCHVMWCGRGSVVCGLWSMDRGLRSGLAGGEECYV